eukprot:scaffold14006_cov114-Isochrysis_galbana.AAC.4
MREQRWGCIWECAAAAHRRTANFQQSRPKADGGLRHHSAAVEEQRDEVSQEVRSGFTDRPCRNRRGAERRSEQLSGQVAPLLGPLRKADVLGPNYRRAQL